MLKAIAAAALITICVFGVTGCSSSASNAATPEAVQAGLKTTPLSAAQSQSIRQHYMQAKSKWASAPAPPGG